MNQKILNIFSLSIFIFILSGFSYSELTTIEKTFLRQDYARVKEQVEVLSKKSSDINTKAQTQYYLGVSHIYLKEYKQAISVFSALTQQSFESSLRDKIYLSFFDAYYLSEQYDEAKKVLNELLILSPYSHFLSEIYMRLGRVHLKLAQWDQAHVYLRKVVYGFPESMDDYTARQLLEQKKYFSVQVGSFLDRKRAEQLALELKRKKQKAYIVMLKNQNQKMFYRVRVGRLASLKQAQKLKSQLSRKGYLSKIFP